MEGKNILHSAVKTIENEKQVHKAKLVEIIKESKSPIPDDLLEEFFPLLFVDALDILSHHPGFQVNQKISSLRLSRQIYEECLADLNGSLRIFALKAKEPDWFFSERRKEFERVEIRIQKDIFALSNAAVSLHDIAKHINIPGCGERLKRDYTENAEHHFVRELRNVIHHVSPIKANWEIRDVWTEQTSHFYISTGDVRRQRNKKWNELAESYLNEIGKKIYIDSLFSNYSKRVFNLHDWLIERIESNLPSEVVDCRRCIREVRARGARAQYKVLIRAWIDNHVNPYDHIEKYLTSEQYKEISEMPERSKAQIERIIEYADEYEAVDEELRGLIYELFSI